MAEWRSRVLRTCLLISLTLSFLFSHHSATVSAVGGDTDASASSASEGVIDPRAASTVCNVTGTCLVCTDEQKVSDPACRSTGYRQAITCVETYSSSSSSLDPFEGSGTRNRSSSRSERTPARSSGTPGDSTPEGDSDADEQAASRSSGETLEKADDDYRKRKSRAGSRFRGATNGGRRLGDGGENDMAGDSDGSRSSSSSSDNSSSDSSSSDGSGSDSSSSSDGSSAGGSVTADTVVHRESSISVDDGGERPTRRFSTFESCRPETAGLSVAAFEGLMLLLLAVSGPVVYYRKRKWASTAGMARLPTSSRF